MEGGSGVTRSIIDQLHSGDVQVDQMESETMVLVEVISMKFILGVS